MYTCHLPRGVILSRQFDSKAYVSTDIGGTFTDFIIQRNGRLEIFKLPSTPEQPSLAVQQGFDRLAKQHTGLAAFCHGTTVATNAVLQRRGAKTALITTKGFRDIIEIARQQRVDLYDFKKTRPQPLIPPALRFEIHERIGADGKSLLQPSKHAIEQLSTVLSSLGVESIAVVLLFSFLNTHHELLIRDALTSSNKGCYLSLSSEVLQEFREYERMSTTVLDAYIKPMVNRYLDELELLVDTYAALAQDHIPIYIMQSNGGVAAIPVIRRRPVSVLLSGPAGGVSASKALGKVTKHERLITLDAGGTSADVSLILDGQACQTAEGAIDGLPIRVPMIDIVTIGAGGGSIAWVDDGGALRVGPRSAGAVPGPICYNRGGSAPTLCDSDFLCGYLDPERFNPEITLDRTKTQELLEGFARKLDLEFERTLLGIGAVARSNMVRALRSVSIERGHDPREFALLAFGGAGPIHAAFIATELAIPTVIIPPHPGAFSAFGLLVADAVIHRSMTKLLTLGNLSGGLKGSSGKDRVDIVRSIHEVLEAFTNELQKELVDLGLADASAVAVADADADAEARADTNSTIVYHPEVDMRYHGQSYEIPVPFDRSELDQWDQCLNNEKQTNSDSFLHLLRERFCRIHQQRYGYSTASEIIEIVTVRLTARTSRPEVVIPRAAHDVPGKPWSTRDVLFPSGLGWVSTPIYDRKDLYADFTTVGPAIIHEPTSTIVVPPGVKCTNDSYGILTLTIGAPNKKLTTFDLD